MAERTMNLQVSGSREVPLDDAPSGAGRPWLDELVARYGEPKVHAGPVPTMVQEPGYVQGGVRRVQRECWVWFPEGKNYNLALDQHKGHWQITANAEWGKKARAEARIDGTDAPPPAAVRAVLVAAQFLEA